MTVGHSITPFITIYKRSGDVFTKLSNPATLPPETWYGITFSTDGVYMAGVSLTAPFITIYKRSGDVFTKLADPAYVPTGVCYSIAFSADGYYLVVGGITAPGIIIYKRAGDVFTPTVTPTIGGTGFGVSFYQSGAAYMGNFIAVASDVTPFISVYRDGYPFDPFTQFQVPLGAAVNGTTPPANTATRYPMPWLKRYIKARALL
jgi:hypothetical protein